MNSIWSLTGSVSRLGALCVVGGIVLPLYGATSADHDQAAENHAVHATLEHHDPDPRDIGHAGVIGEARRTVRIKMLDAMRFSPAHITVQQGETVRFRITNPGKLVHEWVLGSKQSLQEHQALMAKHPDMAHTDGNSISLQPGQHGELVWKFSATGTVYFACLQPGHAQAGMRGQIMVKAPVRGDSHKGHSH